LETINKTSFDGLSAAFAQYVSRPDLLNRNFESYVQVSHNLYELLFSKHKPPSGRLIISPDGKYFPFEALVTSIRPVTYFLDEYAVSYTYSGRYLLNAFNTSMPKHVRTFLGIAPVKVAGLPELYASDQSLEQIGRYFSQTTIQTGHEASKGNFLREFYDYKIIQLYTHATDGGYTNEPMIYFSDSTLNLSDLFLEKKPATNLIVLSACETASGKLYSGEGVFNFNRGFAALGIPSCVSNLWQVDNRSTYRLTELFYKYVARGMPLDLALQQAKKEFRNTSDMDEEKLPYYWAASMLVGKANPIAMQKNFEWSWVIIVCCTAMLSLILIRLNNRATKKFNVR
jgi:CHAT domain-containing protein